MAKDQKKGMGNWKPLKDPGPPRTIVQTLLPADPITTDPSEKDLPTPKNAVKTNVEIGGGKSK